MRKTLFLHVGHQKCGSTSIQHWLADNPEFLKKSDICYLQSGRGASYVHHRLAVEIMKASSAEELNRPHSIYEKLRIEIENSSARNFIVSAENFIQLRQPKHLSYLKQCLPKDVDIHIVFIYRNQQGWLASQWAQLAKNGTVLSSYNDWFEKYWNKLLGLRYREICDLWIQAIQPVKTHVLSFEDLVSSEEGLIRGFFNSLNLSSPSIDLVKSSKRHNVSPSAKAILLCQNVFKILKEHEELDFLFTDGHIVHRECISGLVQEFAIQNKIGKGKKWSDPSKKLKVFRYYEEENERLINQFSSRDRFQLFMTPPNSEPSVESTIDDLRVDKAIEQAALNFVLVKLIKGSILTKNLTKSISIQNSWEI